jgi:hypothetical protein
MGRRTVADRVPVSVLWHVGSVMGGVRLSIVPPRRPKGGTLTIHRSGTPDPQRQLAALRAVLESALDTDEKGC